MFQATGPEIILEPAVFKTEYLSKLHVAKMKKTLVIIMSQKLYTYTQSPNGCYFCLCGVISGT